MAAEHMIDRGFRELAFCGYPGAGYSDRRCQAFTELVEDAGLAAYVYAPHGRRRITGVRQSEQHGLIYENMVAP